MINFKFPLQLHQKNYIPQYEELEFSWLTQMENDYTINSSPHHLCIYLIGRMYFCQYDQDLWRFSAGSNAYPGREGSREGGGTDPIIQFKPSTQAITDVSSCASLQGAWTTLVQ